MFTSPVITHMYTQTEQHVRKQIPPTMARKRTMTRRRPTREQDLCNSRPLSHGNQPNSNGTEHPRIVCVGNNQSNTRLPSTDAKPQHIAHGIRKWAQHTDTRHHKLGHTTRGVDVEEKCSSVVRGKMGYRDCCCVTHRRYVLSDTNTEIRWRKLSVEMGVCVCVDVGGCVRCERRGAKGGGSGMLCGTMYTFRNSSGSTCARAQRAHGR